MKNKTLKIIVAILVVILISTILLDKLVLQNPGYNPDSSSGSSVLPYSIADITSAPSSATFEVKDSQYASKKYQYNTVAKMKSAKLTKGTKVSTLGYYSKGDNGAANYLISDDMSLLPNNATVIRLNNGLFAVLQTPGDAVFVEQLGAHGDGRNDDSAIINLALNSGFKNVLFNPVTYRCCSEITVNQSDVNIFANSATLKTDSGYTGTREWFFVVQADNIYIDQLKIYSDASTPASYKTQFCIMNAADVTVNSCGFEIPAGIVTRKNNDSVAEHTNMDLYTNWQNVEIADCVLVNDCGSQAGGCIWIRDLFNKGCENLQFNGNRLYKRSHDEILAVFMGQIRDVTIENNSFITKENGDFSPSSFNFCFGQTNSMACDNILFANNVIDTESSCFLAAFGNCDNVTLTGNDITYRQVGNNTVTIFTFLDNSNVGTVNIENNRIDITALKNLYMLYRLNCNIRNNTVTSNFKCAKEKWDTCTDLGDNSFTVR